LQATCWTCGYTTETMANNSAYLFLDTTFRML
jgi:hypothetical protein